MVAVVAQSVKRPVLGPSKRFIQANTNSIPACGIGVRGKSPIHAICGSGRQTCVRRFERENWASSKKVSWVVLEVDHPTGSCGPSTNGCPTGQDCSTGP